jgi:V8-like Glu-specific endopeptidase
MKSQTIVITLLLIFGFSCSPIKKEQRLAELNNSVFAISVIYKYEGTEKRATSGTGFLVRDNLIASAAHIQTEVERMMRISPKSTRTVVAWKKLPNGETLELPLEFVGKDEDSDLAIYRFDSAKTEKQNVSPLKLAERLPAIGEEVASIGYYGDFETPFNSLGAVSMIDKDEDIYSDLTLMPGNSGSPVCSLKTGEVFGVNIKVMTIGDGTIRLGIAKKADKLKTLLEKYQ